MPLLKQTIDGIELSKNAINIAYLSLNKDEDMIPSMEDNEEIEWETLDALNLFVEKIEDDTDIISSMVESLYPQLKSYIKSIKHRTYKGEKMLMLTFNGDRLTFKSKPITFGKVKHGIIEITIHGKWLCIFDDPESTDPEPVHKILRGGLKHSHVRPMLPNESEEINEDEKQPGKIRMLFRTKDHIDDNVGEIVFDDINSMVKFIESVGGDYSAEIADGFTQGKLMTIDLKTPVIQLAI